MFLCNHEHTVLLKKRKKKKRSFPLLDKKKNLTSALFVVTALVVCLLHVFELHLSASYPVSPIPPTSPPPPPHTHLPKCPIADMRAWAKSPSNLTFSDILIIGKITACSSVLGSIISPCCLLTARGLCWSRCPACTSSFYGTYRGGEVKDSVCKRASLDLCFSRA